MTLNVGVTAEISTTDLQKGEETAHACEIAKSPLRPLTGTAQYRREASEAMATPLCSAVHLPGRGLLQFLTGAQVLFSGNR